MRRLLMSRLIRIFTVCEVDFFIPIIDKVAVRINLMSEVTLTLPYYAEHKTTKPAHTVNRESETNHFQRNKVKIVNVRIECK